MPSPISFRSHAIICGMPRLFSTGKIPSLPAFGSDFAPFFFYFFCHLFMYLSRLEPWRWGTSRIWPARGRLRSSFPSLGTLTLFRFKGCIFLILKFPYDFFFLEFFLSSWYSQPIFVKFSSGCVGVCVCSFFFLFHKFLFYIVFEVVRNWFVEIVFMLWANGCHISQFSCFFCHCLSLCWLRICASSGVGDSRTAFVTFKDPKALEIALLLSVILIFLEPYSLAIFNVCIIAQLYIS